MWVVNGVLALSAFLLKLALDDRDRRLAAIDTTIQERFKATDEKFLVTGARMALLEQSDARAQGRAEATFDAIQRIERNLERLTDRVDLQLKSGSNVA